MTDLVRNYFRLDRSTVLVIGAQFFVQLINVAFLAILLIYMAKEGYRDHESADYYSYRFLGVLLFAFPLGLFIRGRRLMPFFYFSSLATPAASLVVIYAVHHHISWLLYTSTFCWGVAFTCIQITVLPFILRNTAAAQRSEAFALSFSTWSLSGILGGFSIRWLNGMDPLYFQERNILQLIALAGFTGFLLLLFIRRKETVPASESSRFDLRRYDWRVIGRAMLPAVVIATGAGLTIQYISLFFYHVHGLDSYPFAELHAWALVIVFCSIIVVPAIRKKLGYRVAITLTQTVAVAALVVLATTEYYSGMAVALYMAMAAYLIRQPLMNMANPMVQELVMRYVGEKNQEIISALTSATWSGSWYISSRIFKALREADVAYVHILLITATLYAAGVIMYHRLIVTFEQREGKREQ